MIYLIGDTHFGHGNIIRFCNRPFGSLDHMNHELVKRWNSVVQPDDTVYHLGDFAFRWGAKYIKRTLERLNGTKVLIRGNHDKNGATMLEYGFDIVLEKAVLRHENTNYLLQHYPIEGNALRCILEENDFGGLIHGHIHNNRGNHIFDGFAINVSAEVIDYTPIALPILHKMFMQHCIENGLFLNV